MNARRPMCQVNQATKDKKWCNLPSVYAVQPVCACNWVWVVCGKCLSVAIKNATGRTNRDDQHDSRNAVRVTAL